MGVMGTLSCWSQMLRRLPSVLLLLLALLLMMVNAVLNDQDWVKKRTTGCQPEEEVGVGQMMTPDQPVDHHVMSQSCATATYQSVLVGKKHNNVLRCSIATGCVVSMGLATQNALNAGTLQI